MGTKIANLQSFNLKQKIKSKDGLERFESINLKHSISELEQSSSKNFIFRVQVRVRQKRLSSSKFEFKFEFAALPVSYVHSKQAG